MKTVKLTKKMVNDLVYLLKRVGAIQGKRAFPNYVFVNPKDAKLMVAAIKRVAKKEYPYLKTKKLAATVGMHWLNLGPVECKGVQRGYALFDQHGFELEADSYKGEE